MKRIEYISVAQQEMFEAAGFYDSREQGLGYAFVTAVNEVAQVIQRDPTIWAYCKSPVRSCIMQQFPYRLYYRELNDCIQIIAVAHLSRKPGYWKDRVE